jgi:membrane protease YdiL (CAAX protease family)
MKEINITTAKILKVILVIGVLALGLNIRDILKLAGFQIKGFPIPYGGSILDNLMAVAVAVLVAVILIKKEGNSLVKGMGLNWNGFRGPAFVLIATIPCWIGLYVEGNLSKDFNILDIVMLAILFPLAEEIVFRGFGFVFTRRALGWHLVPAITLQSVAFGVIHWLGAGGGAGIGLQIFLITFLGSVVLAVINILDNYTIWSGLIFHGSLNAAWTVFSVSDNAATGWVGNSLRIISAAIAILLLLYFVSNNFPKGKAKV